MSSSLKKLNKLAKKTPLSNPLMALNKLAHPKSHVVKSELLQIVKCSGLEALSEIKAPLNPILSWFDEARTITLRSKPSINIAPVELSVSTQRRSLSLASLPLKSPPCKKCPALNSGLCKCALKRFK